MSAYRSLSNEIITYEQWRALQEVNPPLIEDVVYEDKTVTVTKVYCGTIKNVFKVYTTCDSEIIKYFGYVSRHEGEVEAINDFDRIINAIENDEEIQESVQHSFDSNYTLTFDTRHNLHLLIDRSFSPVECVGFTTRSEGENAFNKIVEFPRVVTNFIEKNYNPRHDKYLIIDRTNPISLVYSYTEKSEAEAKFNTLVGF